jgi:hypothetical protein
MSLSRVAIIPADDSIPVTFKELELTLKEYQKIVGGYIEAVRLRDRPGLSVQMDYYINEDGLGMQLPFNPRATLLYELSFKARGFIVGDAVCIGGVDAEGNDVGLNEKQEAHLRMLFDAE